jgi:DNA adenine methylase
MKYLGGKNKLGKEISEVLKKYAPPDRTKGYIEPFCGSLGVSIHMVDDYKVSVSDYHKDLILLWKEIKAGTFKFPRHVSKKFWLKYKNEKPSAMRAFVGFGCSYNGIWFQGYINDYNCNNKRDYKQECVDSIKKKSNKIKKIKSIKYCSYEKWDKPNLKGYLIYCDPPYKNTTGYSVGDFDHEKFWNVIRKWSKHNMVLVSEYTAPRDFKVVWKKKRIQTIALSKNNERVEKLFMKRN